MDEEKTTSIVKIEQLERSLLHELAEHDQTRRRLEAQEREIERIRTNIYKDRVSGPLSGNGRWTKEKPSKTCLCFVAHDGAYSIVCPAVIVEVGEGHMVRLYGNEELKSLDEFTWFYVYSTPAQLPGENDAQ